MRILSFSNLFPNAQQPRHGVFVQQRLRRLQETGEVDIRVVAPVPWFPVKHPRFGQYSQFAQIADAEEAYGLTVSHPRYPVIPKLDFGMNAAPLLMAAAVLPHLKKLRADGFDFDVIDAHYYYPDGVAAVLVGQRLGVPVVISARGSDLNILPEYPVPKRWIRWAEKRAAASVTVCEALRDRLLELGGDAAKTEVWRNGVDLELFQAPNDSERQKLRQRLGLTRPTLLQAGNLIPLKGQQFSIEAMQQLPDYDLLLVGAGPDRKQLEAQIESLGLQQRVRLVGELGHAEMPDYFAAADALLLPSSNEGLANVLLESMASGTPVIATPVGGCPEVVTSAAAGVLLAERSAKAIVEAVESLPIENWNRQATRAHAEQFGWQQTTDGLLALFRRVIKEYRQQ